jgi:hypothetical protein
LLALGWHFLDPAIRERHDVERLGLNVIGVIPR